MVVTDFLLAMDMLLAQWNKIHISVSVYQVTVEMGFLVVLNAPVSIM